MSVLSPRLTFAALLSLLGIVVLPIGARGQQVIVEDFSTLTNWTSGTQSGSYSPSTNGSWLRMTDGGGQEATYVYYNNAFSSANTSVYADFLFRFYGGTLESGKQGDGLTFFLYDASKQFSAGFYGGSLGYANYNGGTGNPQDTTPGMSGGYLGIGLDQYGNYSSSADVVNNARNGGPGVVPNSIAVRGPGSGQTGYDYLGGTGSLSTPLWSNSSTAPTSGDGYGRMILAISPTNQLTVSLAQDSATTPSVILSMDLSGYARPESLRFGFAASTGGATSIHEISELTFASVPAHRWDNTAGTSTWGTASNWNPETVPIPEADVLLDNTHVSTAQTINVGAGETRTVRTLYVDAPFNYTLENGTLKFNGGNYSSSSGIIVSDSNGSGATAHTVNSNIIMDNNIQVLNNSAASLTLGGDVTNNGKLLTLSGTGDVALNGVISGDGGLRKTGTGTTTLGGANTYQGETTVNEGVLKLGASDRLSDTGTVNIAGGTLDLNGNSERIGNLTFSNNGTLDFGTKGNSNYFLFQNITSSPSGVITIKNWEQAADILASQSLLTPELLNQFYFSGYGTGATQGSVGTTVGNYRGGWLLLDPVAQNWNIWDGDSSAAWGTATNWVGNGAIPESGAKVIFGASTAQNRSVQLGAARTVNAIRFAEDANGSYNIGAGSSSNTLTMGGEGNAFIQQNSSNYDQTISAPLALAKTTVVDMIGSKTLTVSGAMSGSGNLVKEGAGGDLILTGNNASYAGNIFVNSGALEIRNGNALGNTTGTTTIADGATLKLSGSISSGEHISIDGEGVLGGGVIRSLSGTNTLSGTLNLADNARLVSDSGTLSISGSLISNNGRLLTVAGAGTVNVSGSISTGSGAVNKEGSGTLLLSGSNSFRGGLNISQGTVQLGASERLFDQGGVSLSGTSIFDLNGFNETIGALSGSSGSVLLGGGTLTTGASNQSSAFGGVITESGNLVKTGTGALTLSGANTYQGQTTIQAGTLVVQNNAGLGSTYSGTQVTAGGTLALQGGVTIGAEALGLAGAGTDGVGALRNISGTNSLSGAITLNSSSTIRSDAGTLTLSGAVGGSGNTLSVGGSGNVAMSGIIGTGSGGLTKEGTGILTLSAGNTYTGTTAITGGTLRLGANNVLSDSTSVVLSQGATLDMANRSDTIGSLAGTGGTVSLGSGALTAGGDGTSTSFAGALTGTGSLTKAGSGALTLSGSSSYTGATTVSSGTLIVENASALGATSGGTSVSSGATLAVQGSVSVGSEALSLSGTGAGGGGALRNLSGDNSFAGTISLASATTIASDAGSLGLAGISSSTAQNLTFSGAGDISVSGPINTQTGSLTKTGGGTLTLSGANNYSGSTNISQGVVRLGANNVLSNNALNFSGASELQLNGYSDRVGAVSVSADASVDFGDQGSASNYLATSSLGFSNGAVLTVKNFSFDNTSTATARDFNNSDVLAISNGSWSNNYLNVYFYGYGAADQATSGTATNFALPGTWYALLPSLSSGSDWYYWTGSPTGTGLWGTNANWTYGNQKLTPNSTTAKVAFTGGNYDPTVSLSSGTYSLNTLRFTADSQAYTLSGGTLNFTRRNSTSAARFATIQQWAETDQIINSAVSLSTATVVDISGSGDLTLGGTLSGSNDLNRGGAGAGILTLSGNNSSYTGLITLEQGITRISSSNALGSTSYGTAVLDGAQLQMTGGISVGAEALTLRGTGPSNTGALLNLSGNNTFAGAITLAGNTRVNSDSGSLSLTGAISGSGRNLTLGGAGDTQLTGVIGTGAGGLIKDGTGTVTLSGSNTFTGAVQINEGALVVKNASALGLGSGQTTVSAGAQLQLTGGTSVAGETLNLSGAGMSSTGALLNTSGNNAWTGNILLDSASRINSDSGTLTLSGGIQGTGKALTIGGSSATTISGVVGTGSGSLTKDGTGTLLLSGTNTYTGGTVIQAGEVKLGSATALSDAGGVVIEGGKLNLNGNSETIGSLAGNSGGEVSLGAATLTTGADSSTTTYAGTITGTGGLTKTGSGNFTLSGNNTFSGETVVSQGALTVSSNTALGSTSGSTTVEHGAQLKLQGGVTVSGESLTIGGTGISASGALANSSGSNTWTGAINLDGGARISSEFNSLLTLAGNITGSGATLSVGGAGNTTISSGINTGVGTLHKDGSGTLTLTGSSSFTGTTTVAAGTLALGADNALSDSSSVILQGSGIFNVGNRSDTVASLEGTGGTLALATGGELTVVGDISTSFAGNFSGNGTFVKNGSGTMTIESNINFDGTVIVNGGTLAFTSGASIDTLKLNNGATLALGGIEALYDIGNLVITGSATIDFGTGSVTLSADTLSTPGGATLSITNWTEYLDYFFATNWSQNASGSNPINWTTGPVPPRGTTPLDQTVFDGYNGSNTAWLPIDGNPGQGMITPVPEPSTYGLLFTGSTLALLGFHRWSKRRSKKSPSSTNA